MEEAFQINQDHDKTKNWYRWMCSNVTKKLRLKFVSTTCVFNVGVCCLLFQYCGKRVDCSAWMYLNMISSHSFDALLMVNHVKTVSNRWPFRFDKSFYSLYRSVLHWNSGIENRQQSVQTTIQWSQTKGSFFGTECRRLSQCFTGYFLCLSIWN